MNGPISGFRRIPRPDATLSCDCCNAAEQPGVAGCWMCTGEHCADCLDPACSCCAGGRHQGAEPIECEHQWEDDVWFCVRCGCTEPPEGADNDDDDDEPA